MLLVGILGSRLEKKLTLFLVDCFRDNQFDAIIHTAALHRPHIVLVPIQRFIDVNVTGKHIWIKIFSVISNTI